VVRNDKDEPIQEARIWLVAHRTPDDGNGLHQVASNEKGEFEIKDLEPGAYAVRVSFPDYSPVVKEKLWLRPGEERRLDISLRPLPADLRGKKTKNGKTLAEEDWEWVLRTRTSIRSVLRFLPEPAGANPQGPSAAQGVVEVRSALVGGDLWDDPLAVGFAYELLSEPARSQLLLTGAASAAHSTGGALEAHWKPGSVNAPAFSVGLARDSVPGTGRDQLLNGYRMAMQNSAVLPGAVEIIYGVSYLGASDEQSSIHRADPGLRVQRSLGEQAQLRYSFSSAPHPFSHPASLGGVESTQLEPSPVDSQHFFGRLSRRQGELELERARHQELAAEFLLGKNGRVLAAAFLEDVQDVVLHGQGVGVSLDPQEFLQDTSGQFIYDGGAYSGAGFRAGYGTTVFNRFDTLVSYVYATGLTLREGTLASSLDLRQALTPRAAHALTARLRMTIPGSNTDMQVGYRWVSLRLVTRLDAYDPGETYADPYLDIQLRQPVPAFFFVPRGFEFRARLRNPLAQGQVGVGSDSGGTLQLSPLPRSFHGGLSFYF
jgi:hypothetical protein